MTKDDLAGLQHGDLVRHKQDGRAMVVVNNDGRTVTALRAVTLTNPDEWDLIKRHKWREE